MREPEKICKLYGTLKSKDLGPTESMDLIVAFGN